MSTQSKTKAMPMLDLKVYVRVVAAVFSISAATAFVFALLRLLNPELFYLYELQGSDLGNNLVKKWRSIKDNFFRYLKKIKVTSKSGSGATNVKNIIYIANFFF